MIFIAFTLLMVSPEICLVVSGQSKKLAIQIPRISDDFPTGVP
jgi:hypothetical protein